MASGGRISELEVENAALRAQVSELQGLRKQGHTLLASLETVVAGRPLHPAFA